MLNYVAFGAPMGGWKTSGVGSRHGANGIRKYCKTQTIMSQKFAPKKDINMYPYAPWRTRLQGRLVRLVRGR